jgi:hypothetical protein
LASSACWEWGVDRERVCLLKPSSVSDTAGEKMKLNCMCTTSGKFVHSKALQREVRAIFFLFCVYNCGDQLKSLLVDFV